MSEEHTHIFASVPEALKWEVVQYLGGLGGEIISIKRQAESRTGIGATLPRKYVADFESWLQNFSDGRGQVSKD